MAATRGFEPPRGVHRKNGAGCHYFEHVAEIIRTDSTCNSCCPALAEALPPADGLLLRAELELLDDDASSRPMIST